jgi:hypothetical protein
LTLSTCALVSRTKIGVAETPIAIIALVRLGPRNAASLDREAHAVDRRELTVVGAEMGAQVAQLEQRVHRWV